MVLPKI